MLLSGSAERGTDGDSGGKWEGLSTLKGSPIPRTVEGLALYNELWSKLRWTLGTTFSMPYGKRADWVGELSRRLAFVVLENRPDKPRPLF